MIQNILKSLLSVHKMMFQNLSSKLYKNNDDDKVIQISSIVINNNKKDSELNVL